MIPISINLYLEKDKKEAFKELNCYSYLSSTAKTLVEQGKLDDALVYHQNMIRSINELQRYRNNKLSMDQAQLILKEIESEEQMQSLIFTERG